MSAEKLQSAIRGCYPGVSSLCIISISVTCSRYAIFCLFLCSDIGCQVTIKVIDNGHTGVIVGSSKI